MSREREEKRRAEKDGLLPLHPLIPAIAIPSCRRGSSTTHALLTQHPDCIGYLFSFWIAVKNLSNTRRKMPSRFEIRVLIDPVREYVISSRATQIKIQTDAR